MPELELVVRTEGPLGVRLSYKKRGRLLFLESWDNVPSTTTSPAHTSNSSLNNDTEVPATIESDNEAVDEPLVAGPFLTAVRALRASPQSESFIPVTTHSFRPPEHLILIMARTILPLSQPLTLCSQICLSSLFFFTLNFSTSV